MFSPNLMMKSDAKKTADFFLLKYAFLKIIKTIFSETAL